MENKTNLLKENSKLEITQEKWFRNISRSNILIKKLIYTLSLSDTKRVRVYENGILVSTKPINIFLP